MPSWGIHLAVSQELSKNMNEKEKQAFTLGNLLPDVNNGYLIPNATKVITHNITHYMPNRNYIEKEQIKNIYQDYKILCHNMKEKLNDPMLYGYMAHILTDYYWNYYSYVKKGVFENEKLVGVYQNDQTIFYGENEEIRKMKVNDFNCFSKHLYQNILEKVCFTDKTLVEQAKKIPVICVEESDIQKVNQYFERVEEKLQNVNDTYKIYTKQEFENGLKENIQFIQNMLTNN